MVSLCLVAVMPILDFVYPILYCYLLWNGKQSLLSCPRGMTVLMWCLLQNESRSELRLQTMSLDGLDHCRHHLSSLRPVFLSLFLSELSFTELDQLGRFHPVLCLLPRAWIIARLTIAGVFVLEVRPIWVLFEFIFWQFYLQRSPSHTFLLVSAVLWI